jgi:hypothetical protein
VDARWITKLEVDLQALAMIRSRTRRTARKVELLTHYADYLSALSRRDHDPVLVRCLIWAADVGDWEQALCLAQWALSVPLPAPHEFKRTLREVVLDIMSEQVNAAHPVEYWERLAELTQVDQGDMSDRTRAKFYKAWAQQYLILNPNEALRLAQQAQKYGAAVKTLINQLHKQLKVIPN